jgi:translation initiation factor eIF-6, putative
MGVLVRPDIADAEAEAIAAELGVGTVETTIGGTATVGAVCVGTRAGVVVTDQITQTERERIGRALDVPVATVPGPINAVGNVVVANSRGALVHPDFDDAAVATIASTLDVTVHRGTLAGVGTVGMAAVATDAGVLSHPKASEQELLQLEKALEVPADIGTVNYGGPLVGSGLVVAEGGYIAGSETTGPELTRIEETLGFLDG